MNRGSGYCWRVCRVSVFKPWLPSAAGGCQQSKSTEVESRIVSTIRFVLPFHRHFMSHACFAGLNRSNGAEIIPLARTHRSRQTDRAIPDQNEACGRLEIRVLHLQNHVFMEDWARRGRSLALRH